MRHPILGMLLVLTSALGLRGSNWEPIAPEVWAMKEDPAQGIAGAVVLEQRMTFTGYGIKHLMRIRVLSEGGKAAVEFRQFLPEANDLEGRTVQRDGTAVAFDKVKDFIKKTITNGADGQEVKVLIPPGLTTDCVVEIRWVDRAQGGEDHQLPDSLDQSAAWQFNNPYMTRELILEFWPGFHWGAIMDRGTCKEPAFVKEGRHFTYTFKNLPGQAASPFTLGPLSGRPSLRVWKQPWFLADTLRSEDQAFWETVTYRFLKPFFHDKMKKGKAFKALAKELTQDLPANGAQAAEQICVRLDRRILNQDWPTLEEAGRFKKNETLGKIDSLDLEEAAVKGRTDGMGMALLFEALLEGQGLHPLYAFVRDRNHSFLDYRIRDIHQLDTLLIGVPFEAGRTLWFDCSMRFAAGGLVHPNFQGVDALVVDTDTWRPRPEVIPAQPAAFNRSVYQFQLALGDGEEKVALKAAFSGFPELKSRRRYMDLSPVEADRSLKEDMEKAMKDATITNAQVLGALDPDQNVHFQVEGKLDLPTGTFNLDPFPGMPAPLWLPGTWPEPRTVPIMMEYLRTQDASCDFTLPPGYALSGVPAFQKENSFGKVLLQVTQKSQGASTLVHVTFRVELLRLSGPASAEGELRTFIGWVKEAYQAMLTLEKA